MGHIRAGSLRSDGRDRTAAIARPRSDGGGLAAIDAGIDDAQSRAAWEALIAGPLRGRRLTRVIATHFHPDHVGLAGWLCERFGLQLAMSEAEYLIALNIRLDPQGLRSEPYRGFYRSHGLTEESTELLLGNGLQYLRMVSAPPRTFLRLIAEERELGGSPRAVARRVQTRTAGWTVKSIYALLSARR